MAELNLKQIEDKLNEEFSGTARTLVFWYDGKKEFEEDIKELKLENARVYFLEEDEAFKAKYFLERKDKANNYLIYAPFDKPDSRENHLTDTIKYSKEFYADHASLIALDLKLNKEGKRVIENHINFFNAKIRKKAFYDIEGSLLDGTSVELALLSASLKLKTINFEEVVRLVLTSGDLIDNNHLKEFAKYDLDRIFWKHLDFTFAYMEEDLSLEKFLISLFLTYLKAGSGEDLPSALDRFILAKAGTTITFMDQLMNNIFYMDDFDKLSGQVFTSIKGESLINNLAMESLIDLDIFSYIDRRIIDWILEKLLDQNLNSTIEGKDIKAICEHRERLHFGKDYEADYHLLKYAYYLIGQADYKPADDSIGIIDKYDKEDYKIDRAYRKFIYHLDRAKDSSIYGDLSELVENIYTSKFLNPLSQKFNDKLDLEEIKKSYKFQKDFYSNYIKNSQEMLVVIISDGFRYELGKELLEKMAEDKKFEIMKLVPQIASIPTYTSLGMAALLPHEKLEIIDGAKVLADGKPTSNLVQREKILKEANPRAGAINYDELIKYKQDQLRGFFVGKSIVYIYHDQIDKRGESVEDEVFDACHEAIDEIMDLIVRLTDNVSRTRFIVTADHGFIYKRRKLIESDKIDSFYGQDDQKNKRFIVSHESYSEKGTKSFLVADIFGDSDDPRTITVPSSSNIFKMAGGGQNYVHGGTSPQELLTPLVEVRTAKGFKEERTVEIAMISMLSKVTGLIVNLDFIQQEAISDVIVPTDYRISFIDDEGLAISNEEIYRADSKATESAKRIFRLQFNLRNKKYSRFDKYYLVAVDSKTGLEAFRYELIIDIAFADDFGFDI